MDDNSLAEIVESAELSTNNEIPMESHAPEIEAPAPPPTPQEYEFQAEGRTYKGDIQKLLKWASQGVGAPNHIGRLSKQLQDYESKSKQFAEYEKTYKPVDEWAKQNPDKWQSLFQNWQQAQYGQQQTQSPQEGQFQLPPEVIQKLQSHDQFIAEQQARYEHEQQAQIQQKEQKADHTLETEIVSLRKQYSNLDFDLQDSNGNSLEHQILEHATKNGISSFRAAFRDYCHDSLSQSSQAKGREAASVPAKTRAALLGKEPAASKGSAVDLRGKNYDQLYQMALSELGIS